MSVFTGVVHHLLRNRPDSPVSELVLLVCQDPTVGLEEVSKAECFLLQHTRCLTSVKHVDDVKTEIALKPLDVGIGSVKNLDL